MQPRAHRAAPPVDDAQARAYLELLASSGPLVGPPSTTTPGTAHPLASSGPLVGPPSTTTPGTVHPLVSARSEPPREPPTRSLTAGRSPARPAPPPPGPQVSIQRHLAGRSEPCRAPPQVGVSSPPSRSLPSCAEGAAATP